MIGGRGLAFDELAAAVAKLIELARSALAEPGTAVAGLIELARPASTELASALAEPVRPTRSLVLMHWLETLATLGVGEGIRGGVVHRARFPWRASWVDGEVGRERFLFNFLLIWTRGESG